MHGPSLGTASMERQEQAQVRRPARPAPPPREEVPVPVQVQVMVGPAAVSAAVLDGSSAFVASPRAAPQCSDSGKTACTDPPADSGAGASELNTHSSNDDRGGGSAAADNAGASPPDMPADDDPNATFSRTAKVAKLKLSDHGAHGISTPGPTPEKTGAGNGVSTSGTNGGATAQQPQNNLLKKMSQGLTDMYGALHPHQNTAQHTKNTDGNARASASPRQRVGSTDRVSSAGSATSTAGRKRMSPCADLALGPNGVGDPILEGMAQAQAQQRQGQGAGGEQAGQGAQDPQVAFGAGQRTGAAASASASATMTSADARPSPRRPGQSDAAGGAGDVSGGAPTTGLLHAALGGEGSKATAAAADTAAADSTPTKASRWSSGSSIKASPPKVSASSAAAGGSSKGGSSSSSSATKTPRKGQCLTNPSVPSSNAGLDNSEGNLIVRVGDVLRVPNRNVQVHKRRVGSTGKSQTQQDAEDDDNVVDLDDETATDFEVLGLLGQGTFAQVFRCRVAATEEVVAVKIVKNKPAYTRQAAVEIDVFRALSQDTPAGLKGEDGGGDGGTEGESDGKDGAARHGSNVQRSTSVTSTTPSSPQSKAKAAAAAAMAEARKKRYAGGAQSMVNLLCYFMHESHLCLVFELLGGNLYEVLKRRQFRGLPLPAVQSLVRQALSGVRDLSCRSVVHCDLKPENILLVEGEAIDRLANAGTSGDGDKKKAARQKGGDSSKQPKKAAVDDSSTSDAAASMDERIKLIDFGSACFEGKSAHTYIQSRFYRSPEVLVGLEYDSAIDMWSLGCVAAELYLGLPILPGIHEHDQLGRISEMIGDLPDWMLEQGVKSSKYFVKFLPKSPPQLGLLQGNKVGAPAPPRPAWRLKTRTEFVQSLSSEEAKRKGGRAKLEQQPTNRYFKRKRLADIIELHGHCSSAEDKENIKFFIHFLKGILDPDPWKRWTANQASMHPFVSGSTNYRQGEAASTSSKNEISWNPPWDSSICKRKLLAVQKAREKQPGHLRRPSQGSIAGGTNLSQHLLPEGSATNAPAISALGQALDNFATGPRSLTNLQTNLPMGGLPAQHPSPAARVTAMTDAMSLSQSMQPGMYRQISTNSATINENGSPPPGLHQLDPGFGAAAALNALQPPAYVRAGSLGTALGAGAANMNYGVGLGTVPAQLDMNNPMGLGAQNAGLAGGLAPPLMMNQDPNAYSLGAFPLGTGAQSFSGLYHDAQQLHLTGDLASALQRPGVVPGMGGDPLASATALQQQMTPLQYLQQQQQLQAAVGLSQQQQSAGVMRVGSYSSLGGGSVRSASGRRPRGQSFQGMAPSSLGGLMPVSPQRGMMATAQPMQGGHLGQGGQMGLLNQGLGTNQGGQAAPATSLLAQQLAEHSGGGGGSTVNSTISDNNLNAAGGSVGGGMPSDMSLAQSLNAGMNNAASFDAGSYAGGTSMSYVSANGTPMMISASASDPRVAMIHPPLGAAATQITPLGGGYQMSPGMGPGGLYPGGGGGGISLQSQAADLPPHLLQQQQQLQAYEAAIAQSAAASQQQLQLQQLEQLQQLQQLQQQQQGNGPGGTNINMNPPPPPAGSSYRNMSM